MSDYTQITDFSVKDSLPTGNSEKIILGADYDAEFSAISTAIASKYDSTDIASEAQAEALALDTVLITPLQLANVLQDNAGMAYDIQQLADPGADRILFWDDSDGAVEALQATGGLEISVNSLQLASSAAGYGLSLSGGALAIDGDEIIAAVIADADRVLFADASSSNAVRYDTWSDLQAAITITESQISDLGSYLEDGFSINACNILTGTLTNINVDNADTTITRLAAGQIAVEGDAVLTHDSASYDSAKVFFSSGTEPTTEGDNGDIFFVY